ncbi:MAG: hypothetical protein AAGD09_08560 [Cyanobacteria bacterium P01_F01_bin.56]
MSLIEAAFLVNMSEAQATKNGKITRFPCNVGLQGLLQMQHPRGCDRTNFVFRGPEGGRFDYHNFQTRHWKPLVKSLRDRGYIAFYLSQKHACHIFITEALRSGLSVDEVAALCRVSPRIIYEHYVRSHSVDHPA